MQGNSNNTLLLIFYLPESVWTWQYPLGYPFLSEDLPSFQSEIDKDLIYCNKHSCGKFQIMNFPKNMNFRLTKLCLLT